MAKAKKEIKKRGQEEHRKTFSFSLDPEKKEKYARILGIAMAVFTVFTFISLTSYLFTWKQDQSLLHEAQMTSPDVEVGNSAGKMGFKWASFLVEKCFGLGSFAFLFLLVVMTLRLLSNKSSYGLLRTLLVTFSGAFLASVILAFIASVTGGTNAFGGGYGGECGAVVVLWMSNLVGNIVTFLILVALSIVWLVFTSRTFSEWLSNVGKKKPETELAGITGNSYEEPAETIAEEPSEVPADGMAVEEEPVEEEPEETEAEEKQPKLSWYERFLKKGQEVFEAVGEEQEKEDVSEDIPVPGEETLSAGETVAEENFVSEEIAAVEKQTAVLEENSEVEEQPAVNVTVEDFSGFNTDVRELKHINVRDELSNYQFPSISLLKDYSEYQFDITPEEQEENKNKVLKALEIYNIAVTDVKVIQGPTVTLYKIYIAPGVRINQIKNLESELAMALHAEKGVRVVPLPDSVGIEVPNEKPSTVPLKSMLDAEVFRKSKAELPIAIGYTISKKVRTFDLADAPHLLVAGATKQGKSVGLNVIISSLLYSKHPSELKLVFIDPKMVEFSAYKNLYKHYLAVLPTAANDEEEKEKSIITDQKSANDILKSLCIEMDERYELLKKAGVNNVKLYNDKWKNRHLLPTEGHKFMPYIVTVIDEFADLTMAQGMGGDTRKTAISLKEAIIRLAQKGRAAGIHVILATQRPEASVVSGLIKSNCPMKIAFKVSTGIDSKVIIDGPGAEKLIGRGDMLLCSGVDKERVQCAMVSMEEIESITRFIGSQTGHKACYNTPYYLPMPPAEGDTAGVPGDVDMTKLDENFEEAARMIVLNQRGSTSDLQRRLGLGYARAGKLMDQLEAAGIVGPQSGSKPREVLVSSLAELDGILDAYLNR